MVTIYIPGITGASANTLCRQPARAGSGGKQSWQCRRFLDLARGTAAHFTTYLMLKMPGQNSEMVLTASGPWRVKQRQSGARAAAA